MRCNGSFGKWLPPLTETDVLLHDDWGGRATAARRVPTCWKSLSTGPATRPPSSPGSYLSSVGMPGSETTPWRRHAEPLDAAPSPLHPDGRVSKQIKIGDLEAKNGPYMNRLLKFKSAMSHAAAPSTVDRNQYSRSLEYA